MVGGHENPKVELKVIEQFFEKLIQELGATGLLVIGLYFILYRPLVHMAKHLHTINDELGELIQLIKDSIKQ